MVTRYGQVIGAVSAEMGDQIFSADQIVNKTLIAKTKVTIINSAGLPIGYVNAGQPVGVVDSWLDPQPGIRNSIWWAFQKNGNFYYVAHAKGLFDVNSLKLDGAISLEDKYKAALDDQRGFLAKLLGLPNSADFSQTAGKLLLYGGLLVGAVIIGKEYIKKKA